MQVTCHISLSEDEEPLTKTPEEIAAIILAALEGAPAKDYCGVTISHLGDVGILPGPPE